MQKIIDIADLQKRLRRSFRDDLSVQWSDDLLDEIIFEAQREYAFYSGSLVGEVDIVAGENPVIDCPADFISAIRISSTDGRDLPITSFRRLVNIYGDFRKKTSDRVTAAVMDFDGHGKLRLFPQVPPGTRAGTLFYRRLPQRGKLEVKNIAAVEAFAMYLMYLFCGKNLARVQYDKFLSAVATETGSPLKLGNNSRTVTGRYY